jgi:predicted ATPase
MLYLKSFTLPTERQEDGFLLSMTEPRMRMRCYSQTSAYPFKIFPQKALSKITFEPLTIFYGTNGSGKSTLLNVIAEKLGLLRTAPFNNTPFMGEYLHRCDYRLTYGKRAPRESRIITSDDVFDFLLDIRSINESIAERREHLFEEYDAFKRESARGKTYEFRSMDDYEALKRRNGLLKSTKSKFVSERMPTELSGKSNGESAFWYFTNRIGENALYLLDEPENSLSVKLQNELRQFIEDSVRFYHCQFVISTHSPFLLSMKGARVYDLDAVPVTEKRWTELENVRIYYEFFEKYRNEFEK